MDKLIDVLFSTASQIDTEPTKSVIDIEQEHLKFKDRWYHDLVVGDSNLDGRRLVYLKLIDVDDAVRDSFLYPQGLAIEDFVEGNYTRRTLQENISESSFLLVYTLAGTGFLHYNLREYVINSGEGFVVNCTRPHLYKCLGGQWRYALVHFSGPPASEYQRRIEEFDAVKFTFSKNSDFITDFKNLFSIYLQERNLQEIQASFYLTSMLTQILIKAMRETDNNHISNEILNIQKYISENYMERITLESLAAKFNISKYHLAHKFKESFGYSPIDYLLSVRLERVKDLLRYSDFTLTDICQVVGISSTKHLYYLFKTRFGISPSQYKNLK